MPEADSTNPSEKLAQLSPMQAESFAREHLLKSGIVDELKQARIFIWAIRARDGVLRVAIDASKNPKANMESVGQVIREFLSPLNWQVEIKDVPIEGNCCYGVCKGCLNGDPETYEQWIQVDE